MAHHRHKRETNARRKPRAPSSSPARSPSWRPRPPSPSASCRRPRARATLDRAAAPPSRRRRRPTPAHQRPVRLPRGLPARTRDRACSASSTLMSQAAVRAAIRSADRSAGPPPSSTSGPSRARRPSKLGELEAGEKVLVTGREPPRAGSRSSRGQVPLGHRGLPDRGEAADARRSTAPTAPRSRAASAPTSRRCTRRCARRSRRSRPTAPSAAAAVTTAPAGPSTSWSAAARLAGRRVRP